MEDKLIDFETSKLAKEKGFDEETKSFWCQFGNNDAEIVKCQELITNSELMNDTDLKDYSAPTQSLLAKWLREEQNLEITIEKFIGGGSGLSHVYSWQVYRVSDSEGIPSFDVCGDYVYDTYESALEKALVKALELIENDK